MNPTDKNATGGRKGRSRPQDPKPYQSGEQVFSIRSRKFGRDVFISGQPSPKAARETLDAYLQGVKSKGSPVGRGPHLTILAQAMSDWGLQRLPFLKSAEQTQRRINRYLRFAELPLLVVTELPSATEICEQPVDKPGRRKKSKVRRIYFNVRLQEPHEYESERNIVPSLKEHRARQAQATAGSDRVRRRLANSVFATIQRHDIQELIDAMCAEDAGVGTVDQEHALIRQVFYHAEERWNWAAPARNPATALDLPKADNARSRVMTEDEERRLLVALRSTRNRQASLLIQLLVETAMRCGEPLEHACWGNLDWDRSVLQLDDSKTGAREVPLSPRALALLHELHGMGPHHPSEEIVQLSYCALAKVWTRACERAGIYDLVLHDLRHTAATRLALATGNVFLVKKLTGHKTLSQLDRYVNVTADDVVNALYAQAAAAQAARDEHVSSQEITAPAGALPTVAEPLIEGPNVVRVDFQARRRAGDGLGQVGPDGANDVDSTVDRNTVDRSTVGNGTVAP